MKSTRRNSFRFGLTIVVLPLALAAQETATPKPVPVSVPKGPWTLKLSLAVRETYDDNVFLQDVQPNPAIPNAAQPHQGSFVTSVTPMVGLDYEKNPAFHAAVSYSPEAVFYHSESSEDYVAHRGNLNLSGKSGNTAWSLLNSVTWIDGNEEGPIFGGPGGVPAIGGIPLRDRRAALVYRNGLKVSYSVGHWFVRPVATTYLHDFFTQQRTTPGYENYIDRQDINGGLDIGYELFDKTHLVLGYRFGRQDQFKLMGKDSPYDSSYHRILVGIEGSPTPWMKLAVLAGPDLRSWAEGTPVGFDRNEMLYWLDASITLSPTKADSVAIKATRYEQPAFSSHSVYEDIKYDLSWRHKFNEQFSANLGFTIYGGDWQSPVNREDWIFTPSVQLTYAFNKHVNVELAYSYDWVESMVSNTAGREYTRHLVSVGAKFTY